MLESQNSDEFQVNYLSVISKQKQSDLKNQAAQQKQINKFRQVSKLKKYALSSYLFQPYQNNDKHSLLLRKQTHSVRQVRQSSNSKVIINSQNKQQVKLRWQQILQKSKSQIQTKSLTILQEQQTTSNKWIEQKQLLVIDNQDKAVSIIKQLNRIKLGIQSMNKQHHFNKLAQTQFQYNKQRKQQQKQRRSVSASHQRLSNFRCKIAAREMIKHDHMKNNKLNDEIVKNMKMQNMVIKQDIAKYLPKQKQTNNLSVKSKKCILIKQKAKRSKRYLQKETAQSQIDIHIEPQQIDQGNHNVQLSIVQHYVNSGNVVNQKPKLNQHHLRANHQSDSFLLRKSKGSVGKWLQLHNITAWEGARQTHLRESFNY